MSYEFESNLILKKQKGFPPPLNPKATCSQLASLLQGLWFQIPRSCWIHIRWFLLLQYMCLRLPIVKRKSTPTPKKGKKKRAYPALNLSQTLMILSNSQIIQNISILICYPSSSTLDQYPNNRTLHNYSSTTFLATPQLSISCHNS